MIKWATKLYLKKEGKGEKESERGRSKLIDKNMSKFWHIREREKQKGCLIFI